MKADPKGTLWPTRKWWVATATFVAGILTMWATTGSWDQEETVALIAGALQAFNSWLVPNEKTPGGVPQGRPRLGRLSGQRGYVHNAAGLVVLIVVIALLLSWGLHSAFGLLVLLLLLLLLL